jgi:chitinase
MTKLRPATGLFILLLMALSACSPQARLTPTPTSPFGTPPLLPTRTHPPAATRTVFAPVTSTPEPAMPPSPTSTPTATPSIDRLAYRIVGYYPAWGVSAHDFTPYSITANLLTHVIYAFGQIDAATLTCAYGDAYIDHKNLIDLGGVKGSQPHVKVLIAIGGATFSNSFSDAALTDESRRTFVKSCLDLYLGAYPKVIDGFDLDWEFPGVGDTARADDKHNLTLLMLEFRRQLDQAERQNGRTYLLTAAVPTSPGLYQNYELKELAQVLDWFNLMTYDFHGAWDKVTNFNAPLYRATGDTYPTNNVDAAVRGYLVAGVPPPKIVLGVPSYGRGWGNVPADNHGLYQRSTQLPEGTFGGSAYTYWDLAEHFIDQGDYVRYWNDEAEVPWLYSPTDKIFITYDDAESIGLKADYIRAHQLGGAMMWNLGSDDGSLLHALYERLSARSTP